MNRPYVASESIGEMEPLMQKESFDSIDDPKADLKKKKNPYKKENKILGVVAKRETTVKNLLAIFLAPAIAVTVGAYTNAQMPYLLQDERYFDVPFSNVGNKTGTILFWSYLASCIVTPILGYLYDVVGRFWMIVTCLSAMILCLAIMPTSAPHIWIVVLFRAVMSIMQQGITVNPLIVDYVKS